jgi:transcriptional regulator with GAF, ATPase, and Fis domain
VIIDEFTEQIGAEYGMSITPGTASMKSGVFMPLVAGGSVFGAISLQNLDHAHAFSEADVRLLQTLASSMSVALENARLFDETQRLLKETEQRAQELAIINSVQEGLASKLDIQAIYDLVGEEIRTVFDAQGIAISQLDTTANLIRSPYYLFRGERVKNVDLEYGQGIASHIIRSGQPILINENAAKRFRELGTVFVPGENEETAKSWVEFRDRRRRVTGAIHLKSMTGKLSATRCSPAGTWPIPGVAWRTPSLRRASACSRRPSSAPRNWPPSAPSARRSWQRPTWRI